MVSDSKALKAAPVTPIAKTLAVKPQPQPVAVQSPGPQTSDIQKASSVPPPPPAAPKSPPQIAAKTVAPSVPPPPKPVPELPKAIKGIEKPPVQAIAKPEPKPAAVSTKAPKPAAIKPTPPTRPQLAVKTVPAAVATASAAKPPYLIQLVSVKSSAAANREWTRLQKRFAGLFGDLKPSIQKAVIKKRGTFYRLRADGFASKRKAAAACKSLKAKGQGCLVIKR